MEKMEFSEALAIVLNLAQGAAMDENEAEIDEMQDEYVRQQNALDSVYAFLYLKKD